MLKILKQKTITMVAAATILFIAVVIFFLVSLGYFSNPSQFELSFAEYSNVLGEMGGAVLPASCNSNPPQEHFGGDCPPVVEVGIRTTTNTVSATIIGLTWGMKFGDVWNVWGPATPLTYTSSGATKCYLNSDSTPLPPSGSVMIGVPSGGPNIFSLNCTDGVFWSGNNTIQILGMYSQPGGSDINVGGNN